MDPEELEFAIEYDYEQLVDTVYGRWDDACAGANEGQNTLYWAYIYDVQDLVFGFWGEEWPWVDPYEWYDEVMSSHYANEQAWSETIEDLFEHIEEVVDQAQEKALWLEFIGWW